MKPPRLRDVVIRLRENFLRLVHPRDINHDRRFTPIRKQVQQTRNRFAPPERHLDTLNRIARHLRPAIHHLIQLLVKLLLHRMIVVIDRMLRHPVRFDGVIVMIGRALVAAHRFRVPRQPLMALRRFAPHFRQHAIIARPLARRHFDIVAFEVLHSSAHVQRQVEHPLLVIALGSEFPQHFFRLRLPGS
jgi:hypothetical protein